MALRFALAAAALLALAPFLGVKLGRSRERAGASGSANSLLTFAIPYGILYWAEQSVPSGLAAVLFATYAADGGGGRSLRSAGDRLTDAGDPRRS